MNQLELKAQRVRKGLSRAHMARCLGIAESSYGYKETSARKLTPEDIIIITKELGLTYDQFNEIIFDGMLPFKNVS